MTVPFAYDRGMDGESHHAERDPRRGPGRPLDESRDPAILRAALAVLAEVGYDRLTMDMVAARAHAGKGALYRRWASKAELVIDAVKAVHAPLTLADTGSLAGDLDAIANAFEAAIQERALQMAGLATAASRDPELAAVLRRQMTPQDDGLGAVWQRAVDRGEIPPSRDCQLIWELLPSTLFTRSVFNPDSITPALVRRLLSQVIYPLLTAPDPGQH